MTEPGDLAFGVVAGGLLGIGDGGFQVEGALDDGEGLAIAEGFEGLCFGWDALGQERFHFLDQTVLEHPGGALVEACIELGTRGNDCDFS